MVRKNDIVAVKRNNRTFFVHGSRPCEETEEWRLAKCTAATKDGRVKEFSFFGDSHSRKLKSEVRTSVFHIDEPLKQVRARALFAETGDRCWLNADDMRAAFK